VSASRQRRYRDRHRTDQERLVADLRYSIRIFREILQMARNPDDFEIPVRTWSGWRQTFHSVAEMSQRLTLTMPTERDDEA